MSRRKTGREGMLDWIKKRTQGYTNVEVTDFTESWVDGLAFCAVLHSYCPDLINYQNLNPDSKFHNLELAFSTAEKLGIPKLMRPEDVLSETGPDKFCMITYLAQFVDRFRAEEKAPVPAAAIEPPACSPPVPLVKQFEKQEESKQHEEAHKKKLKGSLTRCTGMDLVRNGLVAEKVTVFETKPDFYDSHSSSDPFILETVPTGLVSERITQFLKLPKRMHMDVEFIMVASPRTRRRNGLDLSPPSAEESLSSIFYVMKDEKSECSNGHNGMEFSFSSGIAVP